jgi:hypothetical protein
MAGRSGINKSARVGKVSNYERADWTPAWQWQIVAQVWDRETSANLISKYLLAGAMKSPASRSPAGWIERK